MMLKMKILFLSIFLFIQRIYSTELVNKINVAVDVNQECRVLEKPVYLEVFFGWPLSIRCQHVLSELESLGENALYPDYEDTSTQRPANEREMSLLNGNDSATCIIWDLDEKQIILNKTVDFPNVFEDLSFNIISFNQTNSLNYLIKAWFTGKESSCIGRHLYLNVSALPELTCEQSVNMSQLSERRRRINKSLKLLCVAPLSSNAPLHKNIISNYTVTWFKNCEHLPEKQTISGQGHDALYINRLTFEHPGIYSCEITHNGMRRYVSHYKMCVWITQKTAKVREKVICTRTVYHTSVGKKLIVECEGDNEHLGDHLHYHVIWKKISPTDKGINCSNNFESIEKNAWNSDATCSFHYDDECFYRAPTEEEINNAGKVVLMRLTFKNIKQSDFGKYAIIISTGDRQVQAHFSIENVDASVLMSTATAVAINNKLYGAYLSYHYSTNMDKFAKEQTSDAVSMVRDELVNLGFSVYDEIKDGIYIEMRAESTLEYMKQSHRVVVILTSEYLKDHWDYFIIQKGFEEMINYDSKMIFVMLPGIKEFIKQRSAQDDSFRLVQAAIKSNYVIEWSNNKNFNTKKFSMLMELAMPKLRSRLKGLRRTSTSSSLGSQLAVLYKKPFRRTMSNETGTTELGSPTSTDGNSVEFDEDTERNR